jgi:hypothetical protein
LLYSSAMHTYSPMFSKYPCYSIFMEEVSLLA